MLQNSQRSNFSWYAEPPFMKLEAVSLHLSSSSCLGEDAKPHFNTSSIQVVAESNKVSPEPSFRQAQPLQ